MPQLSNIYNDLERYNVVIFHPHLDCCQYTEVFFAKVSHTFCVQFSHGLVSGLPPGTVRAKEKERIWTGASNATDMSLRNSEKDVCDVTVKRGEQQTLMEGTGSRIRFSETARKRRRQARRRREEVREEGGGYTRVLVAFSLKIAIFLD